MQITIRTRTVKAVHVFHGDRVNRRGTRLVSGRKKVDTAAAIEINPHSIPPRTFITKGQFSLGESFETGRH